MAPPSQGDIVCLAVSPIRKSSFTKGGSRSFTPSPESAQKKGLTLISRSASLLQYETLSIEFLPSYPSALYMPTSQGKIGESYITWFNLYQKEVNTPFTDERQVIKTGHAHPLTPSRHLDLTPARHIALPFNLRADPAAFSVAKNRELLEKIFPGTQRISFGRNAVTFQVHPLPPRPWPLMVAGLACYITESATDIGPEAPLDRPGFSAITLAPDDDYRDEEDPRPIFELLKGFFAAENISITELQYWNNLVVIVLEDPETDMNLVPRSVGRCRCFYLHENEMHRPRDLQASRCKDPLVQADNTQYEVLRPGIMLSSGRSPVATDFELLMSSGILVEDALGNRFMTVASHGFPNGTAVYHPNASGKRIGEVIMEITHTDVALVKLDDGIEFLNEPFENSIMPETPVKLKDFAVVGDARPGDYVFLDSPFTGYMEGIRGVVSNIRVPSDDPHEPNELWVQCRWDYMGQGSYHYMADGVCGSAIWYESGQVGGFFRYAPKSGHFLDWSLSVAPDSLVDKGYRVVS